MKKFLIAGQIVDTDADRMTFEDVTPAQVNSFIKNLEPNEEFEVEITSFGGSCTAGLAISNMIRQASIDGHKSTSYIMGIAASMASVIACACDTVKIDNNAFMMIHLPWTIIEGNAIDMRKEADNLDKFRDALIAVYKTKFDMSDAVIIKMMEDETWFLGSQADLFKFKCEVVENEEPLKVAACAKGIPQFLKTPDVIKNLRTNMETEIKPEVEQAVENAIEITTPVEETKVLDEQVVEDANEKSEEDFVPKAEVEKRVSGMQSTMAKKMDQMRKEYESKISEFNNQIKGLSEELETTKNESIRFKTELENAKKELSDMTSAFEDKNNTLANLNANVNTPSQAANWRSLKGQEFFDYIKKHNITH